tara:strand:+ start:404 stop:982 length:579 start_codon:yes stop_codon:yes gene_type:complete
MDHTQLKKILRELDAFAQRLEEIHYNAIVYAGHMTRDRQEFHHFCDALEKSSLRISTSIPRPVMRQALEDGKELVEKFPEDHSLPCDVHLLESLLTYREGVMQHSIEHHEKTERYAQRVDWEAIRGCYEDFAEYDAPMPPKLREKEPQQSCDKCEQLHDFDDVVEVEALDEDTEETIGTQFWCSDCLKGVEV